MTLKELKEYISAFRQGYSFDYGLSIPFAWRGAYNCVAFSVYRGQTSREDLLSTIELAYTKSHYGFRDRLTEYKYNDNTQIKFESDDDSYTEESYVINQIRQLSYSDVTKLPDFELLLVKAAF